MKIKTIGQLVIFISFTFLASTLLADSNPVLEETKIETTREIFGYDSMGDKKKQGNSLMDSYDGWSNDFQVYKRTPILFDPKDSNGSRQRIYPDNSQVESSGGGVTSAGSLGQMIKKEHLSVHDEIFKTSMAIYQRKDKIQESFTKSKKARDRHLDLFKTLRGVAILTLSYLDKTVANGLASVRQQTDMDTTHQMLKQISWINTKIANPHREFLFNDVDQKFEACMLENSQGGGAKKSSKPEYVNNECKDCEQIFDPKESTYHYCVCCAETSLEVNVGTKGSPSFNGKAGMFGVGAADNTQVYSLANRAFMGIKKPGRGVGTTHGNDAGEEIENFDKRFRAIYGDVIHYRKKGEDKLKTRYIPPLLSVASWIGVLRDKPSENANRNNTSPKDPGAVTKTIDGVNIKYVDVFKGDLTYGICPSFRQIVEWVATNDDDGNQFEKKKRQEHETVLQFWTEASLGGHFTVADIRNVVDMSPVSYDPSVPVKRKERFINAFCDASAVNAFKKAHLRMSAIALDHIALNRKITAVERREILSLINRVSEYLGLGIADSRGPTVEMLHALAVETDRKKEAERSSITTAMNAAMSNSQKRNTDPWGGGGAVRANQGGSSSGSSGSSSSVCLPGEIC